MTRWFLVSLLILPLLSRAIERRPEFLCLGHSQSFEILQNPASNKLTGSLYTSDRKEMTLACEVKPFGYQCKKGDHTLKVLKGHSGRQIVEVALNGEYDVESGPLYTIYCRRF